MAFITGWLAGDMGYLESGTYAECQHLKKEKYSLINDNFHLLSNQNTLPLKI
jgi:hypothetical protein